MKITFTPPEKEIIGVIAINPQANGLVTFTIDSSGNVYSCQPDGSAGIRPSGQNGGYELNQISGNVTTFQPILGVFYTKCFVMIDKL